MSKMERLLQSDKIKRLIEIRDKGAEIATTDDIPLVYDFIIDFYNVNKKIQEMTKDMNLSVVIDLEGIGANTFIISKGKPSYKEGKIEDPDVVLSSDLLTISKILLGQLDPTIAYFRGQIYIEGDLYSMVKYQEILDFFYKELKLIDIEQRQLIIEPSELKYLLEVYNDMVEPNDPSIMASFMKILTAFVNNNSEAQEEIEGMNLKLQLTLTDDKSYLIVIKDGKMNWSEGTADDATVKIEMPLTIGTNLLKEGDAVSAYMAGEITVEGNLQEAMTFQEIIQIFIESVEAF